MANQPSLIPSAWAASNTAVNPIPATTSQTGKASWEQGFPIETSKPLTQGGVPPQYGDFNGILKVLSEFALYAQAGGQYAWVNSLDYNAGAVVVGSDGYLYRAAQASGPSTTAVNPVGDVSGTWEKVVSQSDLNAITSSLGNVTSTANDAYANASAANAAVNTLDANVVKLSGAQTVGGTKTYTGSAVYSSGATFSGGITVSSGATIDSATVTSGATISGGIAADTLTVSSGATISGGATADTLTVSSGVTISGGATISGGIVMQAGNGNELTTTADNVTLTIAGGTDNESAPFLALVGKTKDADGGRFVLHTDNGTNNHNLAGFPNGILTWDGEFGFVDAGIQVGIAPSSNHQRILKYYDKNKDTVISNVFSYNTDKTTRYWVYLNNVLTSPVSVYGYGMSFTSSNVWFMPNLDNKINLGGGSNRWKQLIAGTTTISTSDERLKTSIASIPDAVLDAWEDMDWRQFQFCDAVAEKGVEKARLHTGLIAQHIDEAFKAHGLDASRYGLFCWDAWEATPEERDEQGNVTQEARPAGDAYSLRYEEALCMEAAYQRRRADRAEARISALEQRLNEMEAVLASLISPISEEQTAEPEQEGGDEN